MSPEIGLLVGILVAGKVLFGAILYRLARDSGAEPLRWALVGVLFDVLGLLAWLCLAPGPTTPRDNTPPSV